MPRAGRKGKTKRATGWNDGVRATTICPGSVDTDMVAGKAAPEGAFEIEPQAIAASVAELLIDSRPEAN